jgi:hypothetical protein
LVAAVSAPSPVWPSAQAERPSVTNAPSTRVKVRLTVFLMGVSMLMGVGMFMPGRVIGDGKVRKTRCVDGKGGRKGTSRKQPGNPRKNSFTQMENA